MSNVMEPSREKTQLDRASEIEVAIREPPVTLKTIVLVIVRSHFPLSLPQSAADTVNRPLSPFILPNLLVWSGLGHLPAILRPW